MIYKPTATALPSVLLLSILSALCGACGSDDHALPGDPSVQIRDSADIRVVEYAGTPEAPTLTLAAEPIYTHGAREGDYLFQGDFSGVLFADGSVVVSDWGNGEVVRVGADGRHHEIVAGPGEGPGEIRGGSAQLFAAGQDSLLAYDGAVRRVLRYAEGSLVDDVRLPDPPGGGLMFVQGADGFGHVFTISAYRRPDPSEEWTTGYLIRLDLASWAADTVGSYDQLPPEPANRTAIPMFRHAGQVGTAGGEFVYGRTDRPGLLWRRADGTVRQIVRWQPEAVFTTAEGWNNWVSCMVDEFRQESPQTPAATVRQMVETRFEFAGDAPEPFFGRILSDDLGRVWLSSWMLECYKTTPRYTVIARDGSWLGVFEPPAGFVLLAVAGGRVLGVVRDELDVPSVAVYELAGW